ncbi:MAG: uroporphyrinogen-III synthase [bacterium]
MRIGITRHAASLAALIQQGMESGFEIIPLPVTEIKMIPFTWPEELQTEAPNWIIFTSANAVDAFFTRLDELKIKIPYTTKYAAISDKTSDSLRIKGHQVSLQSFKPYGDSLFQALTKDILQAGDVVAYPRAKKIVNDPEMMFKQAEIKYFPIICYQTDTSFLDNTLAERFEKKDFILFTAPSAVNSYHQQYGVPVAQLVAIGNTTAEQMSALGWQNISILPRPDINQILEYVKCQ